MSDKEIKGGDHINNPDDIVETTMQEIYEEVEASSEEQTTEQNEKADTSDVAEVLEDEVMEDEVLEDEVIEDEVIEDEVIEDGADASEEIEQDPRLVKHRRKKKAAIVAASVIGVLVIIYIGISVYFFSHFYVGTEINGTDFTAKTIKQVEDYMKGEVGNYKLTLLESDGGQEEIAGSDISLQYVKGKELETLLEKQNPFLWVTAFWDKPKIEAAIGVEYDESKLGEAISSLTAMKPEEQVESVAATPEFQEAEFVIKEEVVGTQIDAKKFSEEVSTAISGFVHELDIEEAGCYIPPKFTKESPEVIAAKDAMNGYLGANITYDFNPNTEVVDASVISQWVTVDADMNVTFKEDEVRAYVQGLADKYNTYGRNRTFTTGYGNTVEVVGGNYGWIIDKDAEYAALTENIKKAETVTREPNYSSRAVSHGANDFGNTYVEIDLTNQHLFYFQDGQCVLQTDIVTGNPNKGNGTPQGTYSLAYKQRDQVLRGKKMPDGSYEYESPVSFWMPFNGGIGFHDANWQSAFGGSRYLNYGSHGCINMPYDMAASLFDYIDSGTPVVCHY